VSRITSVSFTDVQANAMTLSWTALESATAFYIAYTSDGVTFLQVPPPPGYSTHAQRQREREKAD
jgi:hypothetical protein